LFEWQQGDKPATAGVVLFHGQRAAVFLGNPSRDGEAQPGTGALRACRVEAHESFEHPFTIGGGDSGSRV